MARPAPIHGLRVRGRVAGFSDGTSVCRRKTGPHPCGPSCGLSSTRPPRHRGPGTAARSRRAEATATAPRPSRPLQAEEGDNTLARFGSCSCSCFWRARCAPALPGPPGRRRGGDDQAAQRASPGMDSPFRAGRSPLEKPGHGSRTCRARMPGKRQPGCRFLLATSLLDKQKRSSSATGRWTKPL